MRRPVPGTFQPGGAPCAVCLSAFQARGHGGTHRPGVAEGSQGLDSQAGVLQPLHSSSPGLSVSSASVAGARPAARACV